MTRLNCSLLICFLCCTALYGQVPKAFRTSTLRSRPGFHWVVEQSADYSFYYEADSPAARDIAHIKDVMESEYAHITALLGVGQASLHTDAFIVDSKGRMKQLCGHESNGLSVGSVLLFVYGDVKALGAHEETHLLSQHLWGAPQGVWLSEGLAVYSDDTWRGYRLHDVCKRLKTEGKLLPLASLLDDHEFYGTSTMVTYPEAGSFIKFLYERYGVSAVRSLWKKGANGIPGVIGKPLEQVESEWLEVIDKSPDAKGYDLPLTTDH